MRPTPVLMQLAVCLSSLAPLTAAWPEWLPDVDSLVVRADETSAAKETATATKDEATATATDEATKTSNAGKTVKTTNLNTAQITGTETESGTSKETGTKDDDNKQTRTTFSANDPPGSVSLLTPETTLQATPLYKISDYVTFAWNYTSLQGTPSAIDVLVSCSAAAETWTLTSNMTFETKPTYVWDTKDQANNAESPLPVEMYTLIIKDSDSQISDVPDPGYLAPYSGLKFGLYQKQTDGTYAQPTVPCIGCNAAVPAFDHHALGFAITMSVATVLSFTWFVSGLGLH